MKVAVIGGGSTYTPELMNGFLTRAAAFPLRELWLMDIDTQRLEIVGGFAQRMAEAQPAPFRVILTNDRREAIRGAAYVLTQFRVGQMAARCADEYLGKRHGLIGQETTGVGGMAKALRTIPILLAIAADMRELAPHALLVNFTNPAGVVSEALTRYAPDITSVGVCNVPITAKMMLLQALQDYAGRTATPAQSELKTLGLNHLTWHYGFTIEGEDVWTQALEAYLKALPEHPEKNVDPTTISVLRMIPSYYVRYFYHQRRLLAEQHHWPPSRAEVVTALEDELLKQYADPKRTEPPPGLMQRGGAYYSTVATQLLQAHYNNLGETHILNVRHNGAVTGWPADWVLELPCRVDAAGLHPLSAEALPPICFGLIAQVKAYELHTVEAAVHGDRNAAYQALLAHPLGPESDQTQTVLDDLLKTHQAYLPQFFE